MGEYRQNDRRGGRRDFGRNSGRGDSFRQMHDAICDKCGKNCQVPFRPSGDKPILCSDCFEKKNGGGDRGGNRSFDRRPSSRREPQGSVGERSVYMLTDKIEALNGKLDTIIALLSSKVEEKPATSKAKSPKKTSKTKKI